MVAFARVDFQDDPIAGKVRPVVVVAVDGDDITVVPVTSSSRSRYLARWMPIHNWADAGLDRPSALCLDQLRTIDRKLGLSRIIGHLAPADAARCLDAVSAVVDPSTRVAA